MSLADRMRARAIQAIGPSDADPGGRWYAALDDIATMPELGEDAPLPDPHDVHAVARAKGWWTEEQDHIAIKGERVHAEVSELVDVFARGADGEPDEDCPSYTRAEIEWSDCILRLLDLAGRYGFRVAAVHAKHEFNRTRPLRHGGKRF